MTNALATREAREQHPLVVGIQQRMSAPAFMKMLPAGMDFDRFAAVTIQAIIKNPDILACSPDSVIAAIVEAAQDGLEPTGARGGAHLVKFGNEAVLIRDYRGIIRIIVESGAAKRVEAHEVRHGDEFALDYASPHPVTHRPQLPPAGDVYGYYSLFWLPDGSQQAEFMTVDQIEQVRAKSLGKNSWMWTEFFDQAARKTVIKRGANYLSLRPDIRERLLREDTAEYEGQVVSVQRDERLAASRSKIHDRAARLAGPPHPEQPAEASTTPGTASASTRGASAGVACPHPSERRQTVVAGVECGACGDLLAQRDTPEPERSGSAPATTQSGAAAVPPSGASPASAPDVPPAPTSLTAATARVGRLAIQARIVERLDTDDDWAAFDDAMRARGVERLALDETPEAIAAWNELGDRILRGDFSAAAGDDPAGQCQAHQLPWKFVPAGTNRAGKAFRSFWTCEDRDCSNKPTKAWRDRQPQKAGEVAA